MFSSRTNFNKLFLFYLIKIKEAVTLKNFPCYSFYFCTTLVKVKLCESSSKICIFCHSNTTLVKVKLCLLPSFCSILDYSNTTLVKVKLFFIVSLKSNSFAFKYNTC